MGSIEGPIRWLQAKLRPMKSDIEEGYKFQLIADDGLWTLFVRFVGWSLAPIHPRPWHAAMQAGVVSPRCG